MEERVQAPRRSKPRHPLWGRSPVRPPSPAHPVASRLPEDLAWQPQRTVPSESGEPGHASSVTTYHPTPAQAGAPECLRQQPLNFQLHPHGLHHDWASQAERFSSQSSQKNATKSKGLCPWRTPARRPLSTNYLAGPAFCRRCYSPIPRMGKLSLKRFGGQPEAARPSPPHRNSRHHATEMRTNAGRVCGPQH